MQTRLPSIAIIGAGAMGGAILAGLLSPSVIVSGGIRVTNRTEAKAGLVRSQGVDSIALEHDPGGNRRAVAAASVVLIGVKPAMVLDTLAEIAPALEPDALVISVAAAVPTSAMENVVAQAVLRAMPNTPAIVGRAVTGLAAGSRATSAQIALGRSVFETVGTVIELPEARINSLGTISGSGPAYVFYLIEQLTQAAVNLGFTPEEAHSMVVETFSGSLALLDASGKTPGELRAQVTSPNGTTERAIAVLEEADLGGLFDRATAAALARTRELAG